jgi:hypothetical protein
MRCLYSLSLVGIILLSLAGCAHEIHADGVIDVTPGGGLHRPLPTPPPEMEKEEEPPLTEEEKYLFLIA